MQYYENIPYTLKKSRKRRRTISLQISDKSELVINAPHFTPLSEINRFVQEKQDWINKAIQKHKEALIKNRAKEYTTGEHFYYLGESYPLEVFFEPLENAGVVFWDNRFFLNAQEKKDLRKQYFVLWYKKKAHKYISERVDFFSLMLKLQPGSLRITSAESRWGSCSEDNNLAFSFRLIMAKPEVIDYVVVHELMHIKEKNHSAKFWQLVESVMPEYKLHRRWLKDNNSKFIL
jgi:predicted metal-dependent hydrolase